MKRIIFLFVVIISASAGVVACSEPAAVSVTESEILKVHFIDVGQGASQLIVGPSGKTILIDAGNNNEEGKIVDYLNKQDITRIDILIGTHPDADHVGGLDAVIDHFDIGAIYMPKVQSSTKTFEDVLAAIKHKSLKVTTAKAGLTLDWEKDAIVKMIAPIGNYADTNEMSAVIKLTYGKTSFLLTGDAEAESEHDILESGANIESDVMLVGHHGSESSTSEPFLHAVNPTYAVIQAGENSYGHPTNEILKRLINNHVKIYRNDKQSHIIFTTDGTTIRVSKEEWLPDGIQAQAATTEPDQAETTTEESINYANCTAVRQAGKAPLHLGDPGYSSKLDRDGDGVACQN